MSEEATTPEEEKKQAAEAGGDEVASGAAAGVPPKVDHVKRFLAMLIDGIISGVISTIGGVIGGVFGGILGGIVGGVGALAGAGYMAIRDSLNDGRSYGKKFMKLHVKTPDGSPCTRDQAIKRSTLQWAPGAVGGVGTLVSGIPVVSLLSIITGLGALVLSLGGLYEALQVIALDKNGRRMFEMKAECYTVPE